MPAFIRLIVGVVVLVVVQGIVLGFPGVTNNITGTSISIANVTIFFIGVIVALIILKFGTQLSQVVSDAYKDFRAWTPLLTWFFQIVAIAILYAVSSAVATPYFGSTPWAYPLIFLLIALIPTLKAVVNFVHAVEGPTGNRSGNRRGDDLN
jgi:hypothetical protein